MVNHARNENRRTDNLYVHVTRWWFEVRERQRERSHQKPQLRGQNHPESDVEREGTREEKKRPLRVTLWNTHVPCVYGMRSHDVS